MNKPHRTLRALTLIELLGVLAVLSLCAATFIPALARTKGPAQRVYCANNLKGIGQAFQIWGQAHGDAFPMRIAAPSGGYSDFIGQRTLTTSAGTSRGVFGNFRCLSNELSSPKMLICPAENEPRVPATTFDSTIPINSPNVIPLTNDENVSYFVGVDAAETNPNAFLVGDHNLGADGNLIPRKGFVTFPSFYSPSYNASLGTNFASNAGVSWLNTMHSNQGNVGLADGSVSQYNRVQLQKTLQNLGASRSIISGPNFPNPVGCSGPGANRIQFP